MRLTELATEDGIARLPEDKTAIIAVYGKSGHRSAMALPLLHQPGHVNAISMTGGHPGRVAAGQPTEDADG